MTGKTARTIDGMRVRNGENTRRAVGFDAAPKRVVRQVRESLSSTRRDTLSEIRTARSSEIVSSEEMSDREVKDYGLKRSSMDKQKARLAANEDFIKPVSTLDFDLSSKELRPDYSLKKRSVKKSKQAKNQGKKKRHIVRNVLITLFIIVALGAGAFALWGNSILSKLTGGRSGLFELIGAISSNVKLKTDANGRTNVLIFGTSGYDMEGSEGDGAHDGAMLTDSIMVLSLDQETKDVAMISLPRDLYVGKTCTSTGKVNEVFWCANMDGMDEEAGASALMNTIKDILGVDVQYWVHLDWAALIHVVDGIGGITVTLDEDVADSWTGTFIKAGEPTALTGEQALGLARARHGTEMGDFSRGNSQQKILVGIQNKVVNSGLDFGQALGLVEAVGDNVRMSFSVDEIKSVLALAKDLSLESMRQVPLVDYDNGIYYVTTDEMNGISYVVPAGGINNYNKIQQYVKKMFSSNPAVREDAVIMALNGSGIVGSASNEKATLAEEGYSVSIVDDAPDGDYNESYYVYHISGKAPGTAEALADRYETIVRSKDELPADINTTDVDIVIIIGKPGEKASS